MKSRHFLEVDNLSVEFRTRDGIVSALKKVSLHIDKGEVMGIARDGTHKDHYLYKPGDVFVVNEHGWLRKSDHLSALILKYEKEKNEV